MYFWIDKAGSLKQSSSIELIPDYVKTIFNKDGVVLVER